MKKTEIMFKSTPENWYKEQSGQKSNTVRKQDKSDARFDLLNRWLNGEDMSIIIGIKNTKTGDIFYRNVTDVTEFEGLYIISWKVERK